MLYLATAAPDLTVWDAPELITAAQTLGIPHPPGTPLWVLLGHITSVLFSATGPARSVTMLSVIASATSGAICAAMASRWVGLRGAIACAIAAGVMMTVWSNATETEVYAVALLHSLCMLYAGERAGRDGASSGTRARWLALLAYLAVLAVPVHLSALVALPAAVTFAWRKRLPRISSLAVWLLLGGLAISAVAILPLLSALNPALDSGNPETLRALFDLLSRKQFAVSGLWPRRAPLWLQLGNMFQWADWQVAFGVHPSATPSVLRTACTLFWTWCALIGLRAVWLREIRAGRALLVLLVSGTVGVVFWLNLRAGPTFGDGLLAPGATHEARERDYFFALGFWVWGLLAGAGIATMARRLGDHFKERSAPRLGAALSTAAILVAALPVMANGLVLDRGREPLSTLPRTYARLLLDAVPPGGVLFSAGDNDTFPLWYLQQVESYREDVQVVTLPLLGAEWYRSELAAGRHLLRMEDVDAWHGLDPLIATIVRSVQEQGLEYRVSSLLSARDRARIEPKAGWDLVGLVYRASHQIPSQTVGVDSVRTRFWFERVPPSSLEAIPAGSDHAVRRIQELLRCTSVTSAGDTLLVSSCNGA